MGSNPGGGNFLKQWLQRFIFRTLLIHIVESPNAQGRGFKSRGRIFFKQRLQHFIFRTLRIHIVECPNAEEGRIFLNKWLQHFIFRTLRIHIVESPNAQGRGFESRERIFFKQIVVAFYRLFHLRDVSPIKFEAFFELLEMELKSKKTLIKNVINDTALLDHN